jgi:hypothetical protein
MRLEQVVIRFRIENYLKSVRLATISIRVFSYSAMILAYLTGKRIAYPCLTSILRLTGQGPHRFRFQNRVRARYPSFQSFYGVRYAEGTGYLYSFLSNCCIPRYLCFHIARWNYSPPGVDHVGLN